MSGTDIITVLFTIFGVLVGYPAAVAAHELGHALFGKLVGLRVVACGIGSHHPFFRVRIGDTSYYVGRPLTSGLTFGVHESVMTPWKRMAIFTAGGPLASLCTAMAAAFLAFSGYYNGFVLSLGAFSAFFFIGGMISGRANIAGIPMPNDGMLFRAYWNRHYAEISDPGIALATCVAMRDLFRDLQCTAGLIHATLGIAATQIVLGDAVSAKESLSDPILSIPERGTTGRTQQSFFQAYLDLESNDRTADDVLREAKTVFEREPYAIAALYVAAAGAAITRGEPIVHLVAAAIQYNTAIDCPSLDSAIRAFNILSNPENDLAHRSRTLLSERGRGQLDPVMAAWFAVAVTQLLVARNETHEARLMFQEALRRLNRIAATIRSEVTRRRFQVAFAAPLKAATDAFDDEVPLFVPESPVRP
jgi:hypothetical protein